MAGQVDDLVGFPGEVGRRAYLLDLVSADVQR